MANRFQYFLLTVKGLSALIFSTLFCVGSAVADKGKLDINSELFDVGVFAGMINIKDYPSDYVIGVNVTFKASEDFFLQYNYLQTDVAESSFEKNAGEPTRGLEDNRAFEHFDLLLGYNIFQGEFSVGSDYSHLSNLFVVAGVGDTNFGGEKNFTYTFGIGYQIEFYRRFLVRFDFRDYMFDSSLNLGDSEEFTHNTQFSVGIGYLF